MLGARRAGHPSRALPVPLVLVLIAAVTTVLGAAAPATAAAPGGFTDVTVFSGLTQPTAVRFAPDGRVFVAEKRGTIQMFDDLADTTPTQVADLRTEVNDTADRGLLGLAVDPGFPKRPYLYALYTYDGPVGGQAPLWGTPGQDDDLCADLFAATTPGCVVSGKLTRLTLVGDTTTGQDLLADWCQQYASHTVGDVVFGADGALYASGGEGATWGGVDDGQGGVPPNPCGDPPGEGGALRAQDLRTRGDPVSLDGTIVRISPDTGLGLNGNPSADEPDPNTRRIVAYGLRNPFRMTTRPGTGELWLAEVGWRSVEEIDRLRDPRERVRNFGWPCYEGTRPQPEYAAAGLSICTDLYAQGPVTSPWFGYAHGKPLSGRDDCTTGPGSSISGVAFRSSAGNYPSSYDGALFFSDFSRNCIWVMRAGADGLPDPATVRSFVSDAAGPVDLQVSPQGDLFYVDVAGGTVRRISYGG